MVCRLMPCVLMLAVTGCFTKNLGQLTERTERLSPGQGFIAPTGDVILGSESYYLDRPALTVKAAVFGPDQKQILEPRFIIINRAVLQSRRSSKPTYTSKDGRPVIWLTGNRHRYVTNVESKSDLPIHIPDLLDGATPLATDPQRGFETRDESGEYFIRVDGLEYTGRRPYQNVLYGIGVVPAVVADIVTSPVQLILLGFAMRH